MTTLDPLGLAYYDPANPDGGRRWRPMSPMPPRLGEDWTGCTPAQVDEIERYLYNVHEILIQRIAEAKAYCAAARPPVKHSYFDLACFRVINCLERMLDALRSGVTVRCDPPGTPPGPTSTSPQAECKTGLWYWPDRFEIHPGFWGQSPSVNERTLFHELSHWACDTDDNDDYTKPGPHLWRRAYWFERFYDTHPKHLIPKLKPFCPC